MLRLLRRPISFNLSTIRNIVDSKAANATLSEKTNVILRYLPNTINQIDLKEKMFSEASKSTSVILICFNRRGDSYN